METRAREHEAVDNRHRQTQRNASRESVEHAARERTVDIKPAAFAPVAGRDHVRLAVGDESHMTEKSRVENRRNRGEIMCAALEQALQSRARCLAAPAAPCT